MTGLPVRPGSFSLLDLEYVGIKAPQFSFTRVQGADPTLGVEMMSTGEVACFGSDQYEAFLLAMLSAGFKMPDVTRNVLITAGSAGKPTLLECARRLQGLGYNIFATEGTAAYFEQHGGMAGITVLTKPKVKEGGAPTAAAAGAAGTGAAAAASGSRQVLDWLTERKLDLVINDPESGDKEMITDGYLIRRTAIDFGVSLITNAKVAVLLSLALQRCKTFHIRSMEVRRAGRRAPRRRAAHGRARVQAAPTRLSWVLPAGDPRGHVSIHTPHPTPTARRLQEYYMTMRASADYE